MTEALGHLTVVELCDGIAGAWCGRQFTAWGAAVVAIEPKRGSPLRSAPPLAPETGRAPVSLLWQYVAAGKQSVAFDPGSEAGRQRLQTLIAKADVLVSDWPAARLREVGADLDALAHSAPRLIVVSLSAFGGSGPYAGFPSSDLVIQALSGMLSLSGYPGQAPLKLPANILGYACGVSAFIGALAALHERRESGAGQAIEVACLEAVASLVLFLRAQYLGEPFPRRSGVGTVLLPCADGHVLCSPAVETVWQAVLTALAIEPDSVPDTLRTMPGRYADLRQVLAFLGPHSQRMAARDLFRQLGMLHVVAGLLESPCELLSNEHLLARQFFQPLEHPVFGTLRFPGPAGHMSATPMNPPRPAPELNCETDTLAVRGASNARGDVRSATLLPTTLRRKPALDGVRVLDLTGAWIGPYAAMLLADLGADVIKIEAPVRPDVWRIFRPATTGRPELPPGANPLAHPWNTSFYYNAVNRNKR
ncbi:MAG: CaiB/BaiF CoA transferase family protein, partial [Dehalococcoidia bacterium]